MPSALPPITSPALKPLTYTHETMVDVILSDPTVTTGELAQVFGYSAGWVSRILSSDSFQARLAERRTKLIDPVVAASLRERMTGVTMQALDVLKTSLEAEPSAAIALAALTVTAPAMVVKVAK